MTGVVLAGGLSRRMGTPKERLMVGGETLLARTVRILRDVCDDVVVASGSRLVETDCRTIADEFPDCGPLAGLHAGLARDDVFLCACDLPNLDAITVRTILTALGDADAAVPIVDGVLQPLAAAFRQDVRSIAEHQLQHGDNAMHALLAQLNFRTVMIEAARLVNVNTLAEWQLLSQ